MPDVAASGPLLVAVVLLTGLAIGLVSTVVPVLAVEAYVVSAALTTSLPLALGAATAAALGQTVGKVAVFVASRRAGERWHSEDRVRRPPRWSSRRKRSRTPGAREVRARQWVADVNAHALRLLGGRPGPVVVLASGAVGMPPLLLVAGYAGLSTMRVGTFSAVVLLGRVGRFAALVLLPAAL